MGESMLAEKIEAWENQLPSNIKLAYLPNYGRVRLRLSGKGKIKNELEKSISIEVGKLEKIIPDPSKSIKNLEDFSSYAFGDFAKKRVKLYKEYLSVRDANYLNWAIYNVLHWKQEKSLENVLHIQGDDDHIFPIKHIKNCIPIENGTHIMILNKAKSISKIIIDALT